MSLTTVAQGTIERHGVAVAAADPRLLVGDYTNDAKLFMPDSVVVSGRGAHDRADRLVRHRTTVIATFEGAKLPFRST